MATPNPNRGNDAIERQQYPVGDIAHGQLVQTNKALITRERIAEPIDFESLTVSTTALNLVNGSSLVADFAKVYVEDQAVRFRIDGIDPTASVGIELNDLDELTLDNPNEVKDFKVIRRDGADSILRIVYFKWRE